MKPIQVILVVIFVIALSAGLSTMASAQADPEKDAAIDNVRTPVSPVFTLLGVDPTSIEQPTTPHAVAASLLSATNQGTIIPNNYALTAAPYWLLSHSDLTFDERKDPDCWQSFLQSASISLGTSTGSDSSREAGVGVRAHLYLSHEIAYPTKLQTDLKSALAKWALAKAAGNAVEAANDNADIAKLNAELTHDTRPIGWVLDFAGSAVWKFQSNQWDGGTLRRIGAWVTPSYQWADTTWQFYVVGRYIRDLDVDTSQNLIDFGGRLVFETNGLSFSGEYIHRTSSGATVTSALANAPVPPSEQSYRAAVNIKYMYSENESLTLTFGHNYMDSMTPGNLLLQISANLGFGDIPVFEKQ